MKALLILNEAPYGGERCYNALRLAHALHKHEPTAEIEIFLMADAVGAAKAGQTPPDGYYSIERMLTRVLAAKGSVSLCASCMDARGLKEEELVHGARRRTMDDLAKAALAADKLFVF
jgi:uncharacterized protein involved in oxidation of intracellular sulfur